MRCVGQPAPGVEVVGAVVAPEELIRAVDGVRGEDLPGGGVGADGGAPRRCHLGARARAGLNECLMVADVPQ